MFIQDPDFLPIPDPGFRIPDPITATKKRGENNVLSYLFVATNFTKLKIILFFRANFQRIIELFTQKIVTKLSKIWVWDPGSGKNLSRIQGSKRHRIPDPEIKKAPDPGSATLLCLCRDRKAVEEYAPGFQADPGNLEDVKRFLIYYFLSTRRWADVFSSTTSFLANFCILIIHLRDNINGK
jgi:hypothetical protein